MISGITEPLIVEWLHREGFALVDYVSAEGPWGWTSQEQRMVGLRTDLLTFQRVPVLLHECLHVYEGHSGHQEQGVEDRIDERVALLLVDPAEYAHYERSYGWSSGGIAASLGLPRWVVQAYRRTLAKGPVRAS